MAGIEELTQKELRRLSRRELLSFMLDQARQIERPEQSLRKQEDRYTQALEEKERARARRRLRQQKSEAMNCEVAFLCN